MCESVPDAYEARLERLIFSQPLRLFIDCRRAYGLYDPLPVQYVVWLTHVVRGDFGRSLDTQEPVNLAKTIAALKLKYVVITSVDRDDLRDGGAAHFVACIEKTRELSPETRIEILTPDFRGRMDRALEILRAAPPDVMNHNLETAPRLYKQARPGSDYAFSLNLLKRFKELVPNVPTKSGVMVGLGETDDEILQVMRDLRAHDVDMLTVGQYLQPSKHHLPVTRFVHPDEFAIFQREGEAMGFTNAACGPMVRSSYHADRQAAGALP